MGKQKIRRLEEVDREFMQEEKDWIFYNLVQTLIGLAFMMYMFSTMVTAILEKQI